MLQFLGDITMPLPPTTNDLPVSFSTFPKITTAKISTRVEDCTWGEFCRLLGEGLHQRPIVDKHADNFLITCGTFASGRWQSRSNPDYTLDCPNGIRDGWHLESCGLIGLDYDRGYLRPEEYSERMVGYAHLIHSSHSHTNAIPKFRVFHPVSRPMVWLRDAYGQDGVRVEWSGEYHEYRHVARELLNQFFIDHDFDSASTDTVRGFYAPCKNAARPHDAFFRVVDGRPLPVDVILTRVLPKWREDRAARLTVELASSSTSSPRLEAAERYCAAISEVRYATLIPVGCKLFREFGGDAVRPVWERLAARYVPTDKSRTFTTSDRQSMWAWIVANNNKNNGVQ
jgi:hypothetical protein